VTEDKNLPSGSGRSDSRLRFAAKTTRHPRHAGQSPGKAGDVIVLGGGDLDPQLALEAKGRVEQADQLFVEQNICQGNGDAGIFVSRRIYKPFTGGGGSALPWGAP